MKKSKPLQLVYKLLGVRSAKQMHEVYVSHDQPLFKSGEWDYNNPDLIINKVKDMLLTVDPMSLNFAEDKWRRCILWFWFHHAISCAIWKKDGQAALRYSEVAAALNHKQNENQITTWLYLLVRKRYQEARALAETMQFDKDVAMSLEKEFIESIELFTY